MPTPASPFHFNPTHEPHRQLASVTKSGHKFGTVINCMDGRVQLPVIRYLQDRFQLQFVDSVTEAGPPAILAGGAEHPLTANILARTDISIHRHGSRTLALVAHFDCAGNPQSQVVQVEQVGRALRFLRERYPDVTLLGLWVDENLTVSPI